MKPCLLLSRLSTLPFLSVLAENNDEEVKLSRCLRVQSNDVARPAKPKPLKPPPLPKLLLQMATASKTLLTLSTTNLSGMPPLILDPGLMAGMITLMYLSIVLMTMLDHQGDPVRLRAMATNRATMTLLDLLLPLGLVLLASR